MLEPRINILDANSKKFDKDKFLKLLKDDLHLIKSAYIKNYDAESFLLSTDQEKKKIFNNQSFIKLINDVSLIKSKEKLVDKEYIKLLIDIFNLYEALNAEMRPFAIIVPDAINRAQRKLVIELFDFLEKNLIAISGDEKKIIEELIAKLQLANENEEDRQLLSRRQNIFKISKLYSPNVERINKKAKLFEKQNVRLTRKNEIDVDFVFAKTLALHYLTDKGQATVLDRNRQVVKVWLKADESKRQIEEDVFVALDSQKISTAIRTYIQRSLNQEVIFNFAGYTDYLAEPNVDFDRLVKHADIIIDPKEPKTIIVEVSFSRKHKLTGDLFFEGKCALSITDKNPNHEDDLKKVKVELVNFQYQVHDAEFRKTLLKNKVSELAGLVISNEALTQKDRDDIQIVLLAYLKAENGKSVFAVAPKEIEDKNILLLLLNEGYFLEAYNGLQNKNLTTQEKIFFRNSFNKSLFNRLENLPYFEAIDLIKKLLHERVVMLQDVLFDYEKNPGLKLVIGFAIEMQKRDIKKNIDLDEYLSTGGRVARATTSLITPVISKATVAINALIDGNIEGFNFFEAKNILVDEIICKWDPTLREKGLKNPAGYYFKTFGMISSSLNNIEDLIEIINYLESAAKDSKTKQTLKEGKESFLDALNLKKAAGRITPKESEKSHIQKLSAKEVERFSLLKKKADKKLSFWERILEKLPIIIFPNSIRQKQAREELESKDFDYYLQLLNSLTEKEEINKILKDENFARRAKEFIAEASHISFHEVQGFEAFIKFLELNYLISKRSSDPEVKRQFIGKIFQDMPWNEKEKFILLGKNLLDSVFIDDQPNIERLELLKKILKSDELFMSFVRTVDIYNRDGSILKWLQIYKDPELIELIFNRKALIELVSEEELTKIYSLAKDISSSVYQIEKEFVKRGIELPQKVPLTDLKVSETAGNRARTYSKVVVSVPEGPKEEEISQSAEDPFLKSLENSHKKAQASIGALVGMLEKKKRQEEGPKPRLHRSVKL
jgi:hypothetical protein